MQDVGRNIEIAQGLLPFQYLASLNRIGGNILAEGPWILLTLLTNLC